MNLNLSVYYGFPFLVIVLIIEANSDLSFKKLVRQSHSISPTLTDLLFIRSNEIEDSGGTNVNSVVTYNSNPSDNPVKDYLTNLRYRRSQYCSYAKNRVAPNNLWQPTVSYKHSIQNTEPDYENVVVSNICDYSYVYEANSLPYGCIFEDNDIQTQSIICTGSNITEIPCFVSVRHVRKVTFVDTRIQILTSTRSIHSLPRTVELAFYNGVLMEVDFGYLMSQQKEMSSLSIVNNRIASFSFSKFENPWNSGESLETLDLQYNLIVFLPQPPIGSHTTLSKLQKINLSHNPMCVLPGDLFEPLRKSAVSILSLQDISLLDFGKASMNVSYNSPLVYLVHLKELDLSKNPQLPNSKLVDLLAPLQRGNLIRLSLAYNNYAMIPTEALRMVSSSLIELDLRGSAVDVLCNDSFPLMPELKLLNLTFSRITTIAADSFSSLPSIEVLHLDENNMSAMPAFTLPKLKILTVEDNPAEDMAHPVTFKIVDKAFIGYPNLEVLYMSKDPLHVIHRNTFTGLKSLLHLRLDNCSLSIIENDSFSGLHQLQSLNLGCNFLQNLSSNVFADLLKLKVLDLSYNKLNFQSETPVHMKQSFDESHFVSSLNRQTLVEIDVPEKISNPHAFLNLTNLETLRLNVNSIRRLLPDLFKNLIRLEFLDLSYNRICSWEERVFTNNYRLHFLNLAYNGLTILTGAMIEDFSKANLTVDLTGNTLTCSCSLLAFRNEMNDTNFVDGDNYRCFNGSNTLFINEYIKFWESSNVTCEAAVSTTPSSIYKESALGIKLYGILGAIAIVVVALGVTTYRNRWHVKYWAYKFKTQTRSKKGNPELDIYDYDTFICYSHADRQWVFEKLICQLESAEGGLHVCVHERDFLVGEAITYNIVRSVEMSRKVLVVISRAFVQSTWCMFELQMASNKILDERKNKLIFLLLETIPDSELPKELKLLFSSRTFIEWVSDIDGQKHFWARLMVAISKPTTLVEERQTLENTDQALNFGEESECDENEKKEIKSDTYPSQSDDTSDVSYQAYNNQGFETYETLSSDENERKDTKSDAYLSQSDDTSDVSYQAYNNQGVETYETVSSKGFIPKT